MMDCYNFFQNVPKNQDLSYMRVRVEPILWQNNTRLDLVLGLGSPSSSVD